MNVERLIEFIDEIIKLENESEVQKRLQKLDSTIEALMNNPQDSNQQTNARSSISQLKGALNSIHTKLTPAAFRYLEDSKYSWAFSPDLADRLEAAMNANAMTPAVVRAETQKAVGDRQNILDLFKKAFSDLKGLGFTAHELAPGEAQLGFTIPRNLFDNTVQGLAAELKCIDRVVGFFSEAIHGEPDKPTIEQLSTSDPLILIGTHAPVVLAIGAAIKFFIARWQEVENIRHVREQTRALRIANDAALKSFDDHLKEKVEAAVEEKVKELLPDAKVGRDGELENGLRWALKHLMSRVERGMTVEVKFLPPPPEIREAAPAAEGEATEPPPPIVDPLYQQLAEVQQELLFNEIKVGQPLLALEPPPPAGANEATSTRRRKRRQSKSGDPNT